MSIMDGCFIFVAIDENHICLLVGYKLKVISKVFEPLHNDPRWQQMLDKVVFPK